MFLSVLLALSLADWVPARWNSNDPRTLDLVAETPVNCLLLEASAASAQFAAEAAARGVVTLAVIRPGADMASRVRQAVEAKVAGVVLEGDFDNAAVESVRQRVSSPLVLIELPPRAGLRLDAGGPVVGTAQALWPGIQTLSDGAVRAAPTGAPWIDTNAGFLRFLRAYSDAPVWVANTPPVKTVLPVDRYLQAVADAAMVGARWVVALDPDFNRRLLAREEKALRDWRRLAAHLRFYEEHKDWRSWTPYSRLALIQDAGSGALFSGGVLDMIAARHTPVRIVPRVKLTGDALRDARMAVNVDPAALTTPQKEALRDFARRGGTLLSGPPGWKFPPPRKDQITLDKQALDTLNDIWRDLNTMIGRRNLGARLFNVSSMLSNLLGRPDGKQVLLHLVNYSNYKVENITVHLLGKFSRARLYAPEAQPRELDLYPIEEGTGVDIPEISVCAALVLE